MRTYSQGDWFEAQAAWSGFSDEWRELRHRMAMQGVLFPPSGTAFDSWEDDSPSQRAILIRAIRETPALLERCCRRATSWSQVIDRLLRERDEWRAEMRPVWEDEERRHDRRIPAHVSETLGPIAHSLGMPQEMPSPDHERGDAT